MRALRPMEPLLRNSSREIWVPGPLGCPAPPLPRTFPLGDGAFGAIARALALVKWGNFLGNLNGAQEKSKAKANQTILSMVGGGGCRPTPHHSYYIFTCFGPGFLSWAPFKFPKKRNPRLGFPSPGPETTNIDFLPNRQNR